jgi:hypothetical protein
VGVNPPPAPQLINKFENERYCRRFQEREIYWVIVLLSSSQYRLFDISTFVSRMDQHDQTVPGVFFLIQ